jgi:Ca2+-binding RTX toxin-like protein
MASIVAQDGLGQGLTLEPSAFDPQWPGLLFDPDPTTDFLGKMALGGNLVRFSFAITGHPTITTARVFGTVDASGTGSLWFEKVVYLDGTGAAVLSVKDMGIGVANPVGPGAPHSTFAEMAAVAVGLAPEMKGDDLVKGGVFADSVHGFGGSDSLYGFGGDDLLFGEDGVDLLRGGKGADRLSGGTSADILQGGGGNDRLNGGTGVDMLKGGVGADHFVFAGLGGGIDTIADFNQLDAGPREGDLLEFRGLHVGTFAYLGSGAFSAGGDGAEARIEGKHVLLDVDGDGHDDLAIALVGLVSPDQLDAGDFLFT